MAAARAAADRCEAVIDAGVVIGSGNAALGELLAYAKERGKLTDPESFYRKGENK
jgi:hypothetical protein